MRKPNVLSALVIVIATLVVACGPVATPPGSSTPSVDAAPATKADAVVATATDVLAPVVDNAPVNTNTATSTPTNANAANDAGIVINIVINTGGTSTATNTNTGTNTATVAGSSTNTTTTPTTVVDVKPATVPEIIKPDASAVTADDAPIACVPNSAGEICGNGLDDNCNGLIDEGCSAPDPVTPPECSGTETQDCNQTIGGVVYTGKKHCVDGKFTPCLNLAPPPDTTDRTSPTVGSPYCGLADTNNLPVGIAIPFYVDVSDNAGLLACLFYLNAVGLKTLNVSGTSATPEQDITLPVGTSTIFVICFDAAGNQGQSVTLTVRTVSADAGVQPKADALTVADTRPAPDTFVASPDTQVLADTTPVLAPDAGTDTLVVATDTLVVPTDTFVASPDTLVVKADTQVSPDTTPTAGCFALVNNQYTTIPYGQAIVCAVGSLAGSQTCQADGTLTACVATGTARSNLRAVVNCRLDRVTLSGDVVDDLFPTPSDTTAITDICLVGDGVQDVYGNGGMLASNRSHCLPYHSDSSYQYIFTDLTFGAALYRITFFGVTVQGATTQLVRWMNNNPDLGLSGTNGIPVMANDPNNLCSISRKIIDGTTAKLVVNGTGTPLPQ